MEITSRPKCAKYPIGEKHLTITESGNKTTYMYVDATNAESDLQFASGQIEEAKVSYYCHEYSKD